MESLLPNMLSDGSKYTDIDADRGLPVLVFPWMELLATRNDGNLCHSHDHENNRQFCPNSLSLMVMFFSGCFPMATRPATRCVSNGDLIFESENCYTRQDPQLIKLVVLSVKKSSVLQNSRDPNSLSLSSSFAPLLLQTTMPLSLLPSSFTPPILPDFHHCNPYFSGNNSPSFLDCQLAFNQLPTGSQLEAWYSLPEEWEPNGLPLVVSEGERVVSKLRLLHFNFMQVAVQLPLTPLENM